MIDTGLDCYQTGMLGIAHKPHSLARNRQTALYLRTDRNPFHILTKRINQKMIELVLSVITNLVAEQAGTDAESDLFGSHLSGPSIL